MRVRRSRTRMRARRTGPMRGPEELRQVAAHTLGPAATFVKGDALGALHHAADVGVGGGYTATE